VSDVPFERFTDIRDADLRGRDGLFCVESPRVVARFLHALVARARGAACAPALGVEAILLTHAHAQAMGSLLGAARAALPPFDLHVAPHEAICETTGYALHRGAVALGRRADRGRVTEGSVDAMCASGASVVIACDGVVHVDNIGSVFRNAGSFGDTGVLLGPGCGDPLSRKAVRISSGRVFSVPWCESPSWDDALESLRGRHGFGIIACEDVPGAADPDCAIAALRARGISRTAFVLGAEGTGVSAALAARCDAVARIPMRPTASGPGDPVPLEPDDAPSLNVAVASAVVLHEARRGNARAGTSASSG
jgi:tRNA G18 (ribose-2'-O)-methylase SpoU